MTTLTFDFKQNILSVSPIDRPSEQATPIIALSGTTFIAMDRHLLQRGSTESCLDHNDQPEDYLEDQENNEKSYAHRHTPYSKWKKGILLGFLIFLALFGLLDLGYRTYTLMQSHRPISCNCGDTIAEALAQGCKYDSLAAAWLPPACRDNVLNEAFEHAGSNDDGSWPYYADLNKTRLLSLEEVSMIPETGGNFFTTQRWHLVHCMYYWKKMFLAGERNTRIEHRYNNMNHINHCEMMVLAQYPLDEIATTAGVSLHSDVVPGKPSKHHH